MNCQNCHKPLTGKQQKYCSPVCKAAAWDKAHPERARERFRRFQASDKGKAVQNKREHGQQRLEYKQEYAKTGTGKKIARCKEQRRRSREKNVPVDFKPSDWKRALAYFQNKCAYCGSPLDTAHQDHFVPLAKGGSYTKHNVVPACPKCNHSKRDMNPIDWLVSLPNPLVVYAKIVTYLERMF